MGPVKCNRNFFTQYFYVSVFIIMGLFYFHILYSTVSLFGSFNILFTRFIIPDKKKKISYVLIVSSVVPKIDKTLIEQYTKTRLVNWEN